MINGLVAGLDRRVDLTCHEISQGLADTFILLGMPFDSDEASQLNKEIFECIYYAALETSNELAKIDGVFDSIVDSTGSQQSLRCAQDSVAN